AVVVVMTVVAAAVVADAKSDHSINDKGRPDRVALFSCRSINSNRTLDHKPIDAYDCLHV
ncbi:hypothetical protein, partial [Salidesulfovibrio brasiliensis]|uniref:hypothetical protein n=1 Tax=Salidesulfovibrio brasiliensis TaxID=221711 RepID=UPI001C47556F